MQDILKISEFLVIAFFYKKKNLFAFFLTNESPSKL